MPARRVPAHLKVLRGHPVSTPVNSGGIGTPKPPTWLPAPAKVEWKRVVAACAAFPTWLQEADRAALTAYCMAWATFQTAAQDVAKRGPLVPARSSADQARDGGVVLVKNPAVQVMRDAQAAMRQWARELGFTPDSRAKIERGAEETDGGEGILD